MPKPALDPNIQTAIERRAAELAANAPPLTSRQIAQLRVIVANPSGGVA